MRHKYRVYTYARKRKNKNGCMLNIVQRVYCGGTQLQFSLGISVAEKDYDTKQNKVIRGDDANRFNLIIRESNRILCDYIDKSLIVEHRQPTPDEITQVYTTEMAKLGFISSERDMSLVHERMDEFIQDQQQDKSWAVGTTKRFRSVQRLIRLHAPELSLDKTTDKELTNLLTTLQKENLSNTTLQRLAGQLRWFLRWAKNKGYYKGNSHETFRPKFKGGNFEYKEIIYLTQEELHALENHTFGPNQQYLERVRDVFLFACYCGLRFSDVSALKADNITDTTIEVLTIKDNKRLSINLNKHTRAILAKYKDYQQATGNALPVVSNCKTNLYLHDVCKICGIDTPTRQTISMNDKLEDVFLPKYELITFHAARRTFITQALRLGIPVPVIMQFSGHKNMGMLKRYMQVVDDLKKEEMAKFDTM